MADERQGDFSVGTGKQEDLFVSGSSCKIYRDDDMAAYINKGRHLTALHGDITIMIDMYDVRHYLDDLESYEAKPDSHSPNSSSEYEEKVELVCDEERYLQFPKNLAEEQMCEKGKRLRAAVGKDGTHHDLAFSYDMLENMHFVSKIEEREKINFIDCDDGRWIPSSSDYASGSSPKDDRDCLIPAAPGIKQNIDKMAKYVAQNGLHFEYVAKRKSNHRYEFLGARHEYHQYYLMMKNRFSQQYELSTEAVASDSEEIETCKLVASSPDSRPQQELKEQLQLKRRRQAAIFVDILKRKDENTVQQQELSSEGVARDSEEIETCKLVASSPESRPQQELKEQLQLKRRRQAAVFVDILKGKDKNAVPDRDRLLPPSSEHRTKSKSGSQSRGRNYSERSRSRCRSGRSRSRSHSRGSSSSNERSKSRYHSRRARYPTRPKSNSRRRYFTERRRSRSHSRRTRYRRRTRSRSLSRGRYHTERSRSRSHSTRSRWHNRSMSRPYFSATRYVKRCRSSSRTENDNKRQRL